MTIAVSAPYTSADHQVEVPELVAEHGDALRGRALMTTGLGPPDARRMTSIASFLLGTLAGLATPAPGWRWPRLSLAICLA